MFRQLVRSRFIGGAQHFSFVGEIVVDMFENVRATIYSKGYNQSRQLKCIDDQ